MKVLKMTVYTLDHISFLSFISKIAYKITFAYIRLWH